MNHAIKCGLAGLIAGCLLCALEHAMGWHLGIVPYIAIGAVVGLLLPKDN